MRIATNIFNSNKRLIALVVLLLLSTAGMFGQEAETPVVFSSENHAVASATQSNSQMELVMWIMGTQIKSNDITNTISTNGSKKKTYINLGMTPNRILSKTILKKAANSEMTA